MPGPQRCVGRRKLQVEQLVLVFAVGWIGGVAVVVEVGKRRSVGDGGCVDVDGCGVVDNVVMRTRRWVIIGVGGLVAAGLAVAAVVFGLRGVEVASWLAGVAGVVVGVAAVVLAPGSAPTPPPGVGASESAAGSVHVGGEVSGIVSTGDGATNIQHR